MGAVELILVRHGESEANVAAAVAERTSADRIEVPARDADVVLSATGREQAAAFGAYLADLGEDELPQAIRVSPYRRAVETTEIGVAEGGLDLPLVLDERLRDRELGILDALTGHGVERLHPEEAERRRWLGKFYYRPPGGESWADVALRVRSFLADLDLEEDGGRVLVVCHDAVISVFRYVCLRIDEATLLDDVRRNPVPNASVTRLVREPGERAWTATVTNAVEHLREEDAPVTRHPGHTDIHPDENAEAAPQAADAPTAPDASDGRA